MKVRLPSRSSSRGPKKNSMSMLNRMCIMFACRNAYVTIDQGLNPIRAGTNAKSVRRPGIIQVRKYTTTLASSNR